MENDTEEVMSTQKSLQSSHDPGWNDPPSWAFTPPQKSAGGSTPTKRLLNKRVAFPLNSQPNTSIAPLNKILPPTPNIPLLNDIGSLTTAPHKPIIAPTGVTANDLSLQIKINKEETLKDTLENLRCLMEHLEATKADEVQKRLDRMEIMWNEDKLNGAVQKQLLDISKALKECDTEKADQLHIALMTNHTSICSSWIPGIRQLIAEIKNKKP